MTFTAIPILISLGLAMLLGFAAQRASICTVTAVTEVLTSRRAFMLVSFAKTVLWVMLVTLAANLAVPAASDSGWELSAWSLMGGFLFGIGAAINRGCAFSTLTQLASGRLPMLLSLAGFGLGAAGHFFLAANQFVLTAARVPAYNAPPAPWTTALLASLLIWAIWEGLRLWRTRDAGASFIALARADRYRLSTAAFLIGISNAILYALYGSWTFTSVVHRGARQAMGSTESSDAIYWYLFAAVLAGMFLSAWYKGAFKLEWRPSWKWFSFFLGGLLMGLGTGFVPGGNDVLILHGIPGLSPNALPAYVAMICGIALALSTMKVFSGKIPAVECRGDVCRLHQENSDPV